MPPFVGSGSATDCSADRPVTIGVIPWDHGADQRGRHDGLAIALPSRSSCLLPEGSNYSYEARGPSMITVVGSE